MAGGELSEPGQALGRLTGIVLLGSNWVPTDPQRGFEMMFRVYGPKKEFFDKVRALPDVERIVTESTGAKQ